MTLIFDGAGNISTYDEEDGEFDEPHSYSCCCETCLQNHPERDILYGDGEYFNYGDSDDPVETTDSDVGDDALLQCAKCGEAKTWSFHLARMVCPACDEERYGDA